MYHLGNRRFKNDLNDYGSILQHIDLLCFEFHLLTMLYMHHLIGDKIMPFAVIITTLVACFNLICITKFTMNN
jgi:hypothetical protein